jgi:hypothetical protein
MKNFELRIENEDCDYSLLLTAPTALDDVELWITWQRLSVQPGSSNQKSSGVSLQLVRRRRGSHLLQRRR